ncbi:uncharacterized protein LOC126818097 isoform X2 [Patella vulgata]|nr:uncharacterized protein LOC126818097 isoform X2 [Patella vulgata]
MRLYHSVIWQVVLLLLFVFIGQGSKVNCQYAPDTSTNEIKQLVSLGQSYLYTSNSQVREKRALEDENQEKEIEDDLFLDIDRRNSNSEKPKYKFEDLSKFNGKCFDFKFMLSRIMGGFPTTSLKKTTEIKLNTIHIRALADRALTMIKIVRRPDLIAEDLVFSLSENILTDLKKCPSTQLHQALMYGLSRSFVSYKKNNHTIIRNVTKKVKQLTVRLKVNPMQLVQTVYSTLSMNLLEHIRQTDYKDLEETMTKLEKDLEKLLKEENVDVNKIQSMVTNRLGSVRRCGNDQSVGRMFGKMAMAMQQLSKGLDRKDIAASLGVLKRYVPRQKLQNVITQLRNLSRHMLRNLQKLFKALVGKNKSYIINQKILDKDQYEQLLRILNFLGKDLFSNDKIKQLGKRDLSNVMDDELRAFQFEKRDSSNLDVKRRRNDNQDKRRITNSSLKYLLNWIKSQIKKNKSQFKRKKMNKKSSKSNLKPQTNVQHCFNFESAVSKIIGGFPSVESSAAKVVLGKNDFNGLIEKSLTLERLMNQPNLATQELVYSMTEKVLEKQKLCPSAMLGRVLF